MKYKMKKISLEPDEYGQHLVIKMVTRYDNNGKYIKHAKIDKELVEMLKNSFVIEEEKS